MVRVRRENPAAFIRYRNALNRAVRERVTAGKWDDREARDFFADEVQPSIDQIARDTRSASSFQVKKSIGKVVSLAAVIGVGVLAHVIPASLSGIGGAIGVGSGVSVLEDVLNRTQPENALEYYYLFKIARESDEL